MLDNYQTLVRMRTSHFKVSLPTPLIFWLNINKVYDEGFLAEVTVVDFIAEVTLIQSFENSEDDPIEAVYVW